MFDFRQVIYMEVIWQDIHSGRVPKIFLILQMLDDFFVSLKLGFTKFTSLGHLKLLKR